MPPEEALFRRCGAPERFAEDDIYWADRHLREDQVLPDSDLLKAVHAYASEFYGRRGGATDFESFDETALIAIGVLLEEWAGDVLGAEGEGAFVEAGWEDGRGRPAEYMGEGSGWNGRIISKRGKRGKKRMKDKEVELEEDEEEDQEEEEEDEDEDEDEEAEAVIEQESNDTYQKSKHHSTKFDTETESSDDQSRSDDEDINTDLAHTDDIDESNENTESSADEASESEIDESYSTEEPTNANTIRNPQTTSLLSSSHPPSPSSYSSSSSSLPSSSSASSSASSKPSRNHKSKRRKIVHSGVPA